MKTILNRIMPAIWVATGILMVVGFNSCKRQNINYSTTSIVNIYTYLEQNADQFSMFKQIVDKAGYASFLNTYGTYTLFAANNAGVTAYLKTINKASVDNIDEAMAKSIVSVSLIADTINTQMFTDGKMRSPTTIGQFLTTGASNVNGVTSVTINRQANLVKGNVRIGNGIVHIIDNVLTPAPLTLAQMVEQNPQYSIFSQALKATGFYDSLNVKATSNTNLSRKYLTLIAQTNEVFAAAGIADYNALKAKYSTTGDPRNKSDSLYLFVAYRVFPELAYLSDIVASASHATLAPLEVTTSQLEGETVLLNNDFFNGKLEPGVALDRGKSDLPASNGVFHSAAANYKIKVRKPVPVYFEPTDQPEIRRTPGLFRGNNKNVPFTLGQLADVTWTGATTGESSIVRYFTNALPNGSGSWHYGNDYLECGQRFRTGSGGMNSIEFKTPLLVRGRYNIWVDYQVTTGQALSVTFDGQPTANIFNQSNDIANSESDAAALSRGFKRYTDKPVDPAASSSVNYVGRLLGVVNVTTTDRHVIRFTTTAPSSANHRLLLDIIEFRPIDMNSQVLPRFGRDGTLKF
jgi:uncharacterized surface protein with fasciclin (FAS1) repeats